MARKVVAAGVGAVAVVGVALGWRASMRGREQSNPPQGEPLLIDDVNAERFVEVLSEAITHRTVLLDDGSHDPEAFDDLQAMLAERYPRVHADLERETFSGHALLYTWEGSDPDLDPILLMAHQDVVPVEEGTEGDWIAPPFDGAVVDGRIYGRGALDCKGPLIAIFEALEYWLENGEKPCRTVLLVSGHDEEIGGAEGAGTIADALQKRGITPWFVVDEGGAIVDGVLPAVKAPIALIGVAEKGFVNIKLTARGEGGHSSLPSSDTAIARLSIAIAELEAHPVPPRIDALMPLVDSLSDHLPGVVGVLASNPSAAASLLSRLFSNDPMMDALQRTTMVPTVISGGVKVNVVPQSASVVFSVRIIPGDTQPTVIEHIEAVVGPDIEIEVLEEMRSEPSRFSSVESKAWVTLTGVVEEVFPEAVVAPYVLMGATDSRFFEGFSGDVYRFSPFVLDGEAVSGFHGTNESVRVGDARRAVTFFVRLIEVAALNCESHQRDH